MSSSEESSDSDDDQEKKAFEAQARKILADTKLAEWVSNVMMEGKPTPNYVWSAGKLARALEAKHPSKWKTLHPIFKSVGGDMFIGLCEEHPLKFVFTGVHEGENYISCRVWQQPDVRETHSRKTADSDSENEVSWPCCDACTSLVYSVGALFGLVLNYVGCIFWYIVPNCFCVWRWACCHTYWKLEDIEDKMQTGDVLLFAGTMSTRIGAQSHWSHAGIVFRDDEGLEGPAGLLYVFEANFDRPGWDHCDLRLLHEKLLTYKKGATDMAWRPLQLDDVDDDEDEIRRQIGIAIGNQRGSPYDHNLKRMAHAAIDFLPCCEVKHDTRRREMFCSQAVVQVLMDARVIPRPPSGPPSSEYIPRDFDGIPSCTQEQNIMSSVLGPIHFIARQKNKWTGLELR